ncbi:hypothetical protein [Xanthobacter dioxanivorans]|uniref:hypothetical protein n=1 Tax=Xanthobacter dioxanivorans TaxID=2528964 RepID=UPI0019337CF3|nr:hypothetical protein [Xanthobacter dioxanivorans]
MTSLLRAKPLRAQVLALTLAAAAASGVAAPASAAAIGSGATALAPAHAAAPTEVGYWYRGRWYGGGCWNCGRNNGAAVGAAIGLGILGAAAIAGAAGSAPPPPPVVYYEPEPPPVVYVQPAPRPRSCWVQTGPYGGGYWSPC